MHFSQTKQNQFVQNCPHASVLTIERQADKKEQSKQSQQISKSKNDNLNFLIDLIKRVQRLENKLDVLEAQGVQSFRKKKKLRRRARDVPRIFKCNINNCQREYGSITSLKNHRKLKHGLRIIRKAGDVEEKN